MSVTARSKGTATFTESVALGSSTVNTNFEGALSHDLQFSTGNSAGNSTVNTWWTKAGSNAVTVGGGNSVTYTLTSLTDGLGRTVTFAGGVRELWIRVTTRTAGDYLTIGAAAANAWAAPFGANTHTVKVFKFLHMDVDYTDKYAVTAGSSEQLKILNSGTNSITFEIGIGGCAS